MGAPCGQGSVQHNSVLRSLSLLVLSVLLSATAAEKTEGASAQILHVESPADLATVVQWCAQLQAGRCNHIFRRALKGVSGVFRHRDVLLLQSLLGGSLQVEEDGQVIKAEDPDEDLKRWWQARGGRRERAAPSTHISQQPQARRPARSLLGQQQLQQQQGSVPTDPAPLSTPEQPAGSPELQLYADGGPESAAKALRLELLYDVGMDAQAALSKNGGLPWIIASLGTQPHGTFMDRAKSMLQTQDRNERDSGLNRPDGVIDEPPEELGAGAASGPANPQDSQTLARLSAVIQKKIMKIEQLVPALWNLDRIDQVHGPLDGQYTYGSDTAAGTGKGATIYTLDSGIYKEHQEFRNWEPGKGSRASYGFNFADDTEDAGDCDGHGTHVAATAVGRSVGVAKGAQVVAVRVLDCNGSGSIINTVAGLEWVAENHRGPSVVVMSLGVSAGAWSAGIERAVRHLSREGIAIVVASGNKAIDACKVSPAKMHETITVAASDMENKFDALNKIGQETKYKWSNTGRCIDLWAPGVEIWSACGGGLRCPNVTEDAYTWSSGTSMAVPHVAGLAAIYLADHPVASTAEVHDFLVRTTTDGVVSSQKLLPGTPTRMLFTRSPIALEGVGAARTL